MQIRASIRVISNTFTPDLQKKVQAVSGAGLARLLDRIGLGLVSMSKRSFATDASLRPSPWANKKDGTPSTLQKSTRLRQSIRHSVSGRRVMLASDAKYAAIHQLGGVTRAHVIRPRAGGGRNAAGQFQGRKKALAFGGRVFAKVNHPGSKIPPRPFLPFYRDGSLTVKAARNVELIIRRELERK